MVWWCRSWSPSVRFPRLSPTCFGILSRKFAYIYDFSCTSDQLQVSSFCVNFWRSYASFWTYNIGNTQFSELFSYMIWHIELQFAYDFALISYISCLTVVILCQFFKELKLFFNLEYREYAVNRIFLLHVLRYWAEILQYFIFIYFKSNSRVVVLRQFLEKQ